MTGALHPLNGKDSRLRTLEELMDAPTVDTPDTLLSERGAMHRELARRLTMPLAELADELLREGGA